MNGSTAALKRPQIEAAAATEICCEVMIDARALQIRRRGGGGAGGPSISASGTSRGSSREKRLQPRATSFSVSIGFKRQLSGMSALPFCA